jgi:hypothetical protein
MKKTIIALLIALVVLLQGCINATSTFAPTTATSHHPTTVTSLNPTTDYPSTTTPTNPVTATSSTITNTDTGTQTTTGVSLTLSFTDVTLPIDGSVMIVYQANVSPIHFSSSDDTIVSVSLDGEILAHTSGVATIYVCYHDSVIGEISVSVVSGTILTPPNKTIYRQGEPLLLLGCKLTYVLGDDLMEEIRITQDMVSGYNPSQTGSQQVSFEHHGIIYYFSVLVLNDTQALSLFDDFIILNNDVIQGQRLEFQFFKSNTTAFLDAIENVYDPEKIKIEAMIQTPSGDIETIRAFWFQPYREVVTQNALNPSRNLEGLVTTLPGDFNLKVEWVEDGMAGFMVRYLPETLGQYEMVVSVIVEGDVVQRFIKTFDVQIEDEAYKGYVQIDETNQRHFAFDDGSSYIPVGQNVGWYTSQDRKHYDYHQWFSKMQQVGMNYARVWLAAWGFSIFWEGVDQFDYRQDNLASFDVVVALAEEYDIYLQVTILHHGMFSRLVNPMWPGSITSWYVDKYGANPYGEHMQNPGQFFTGTYGKSTFKMQLDYLVARYGYSRHIMAWELFNEVDWIEDYTASGGLLWHKEMAEYLKEIDPKHLVTTSVKGDSFYHSIYQVFNLAAIDFVNVHRYGVYNHLDTLPQYQNIGFSVFNKPIFYSEIGYQGSGGAQQMQADPNHITLHQAIWGGMMGGGAGGGMNWWWDSWIHQGDAYSVYRGAAVYANQMTLKGDTYQSLASTAYISVPGASLKILGYQVDNRVYGYLYDEAFTLDYPVTSLKTNARIQFDDLGGAIYLITFYDTVTGAVIDSFLDDHSAGGYYEVVVPDFRNDVAFVIEPVGWGS